MRVRGTPLLVYNQIQEPERVTKDPDPDPDPGVWWGTKFPDPDGAAKDPGLVACCDVATP